MILFLVGICVGVILTLVLLAYAVVRSERNEP